MIEIFENNVVLSQTTYHKVGLVLVDHILDSFQHIGSFSKQPDHMILLVHLDIASQYYNNCVRLYGRHG